MSGIVAIDLDSPDCEALLRRLADEMPYTYEYVTGRGRRLVYALPPDADIPSRIVTDGTARLEILAGRRAMAVPPSRHPSGRRYEWLLDRNPWLTPPAPAPEGLLRLAAPASHSDTPPGHPTEWWRRLVAEGAVEGTRNNIIAALAGHLMRRRVDPFVALELGRAWNQTRCRPPLPDDEVVRTVDSIAGMELRRRGGERA